MLKGTRQETSAIGGKIINTGQVDPATGNSIYQRINPNGNFSSSFLMISDDGTQISNVSKPESLRTKSDTIPIHHICTDKNCLSTANGGPWTPIFQKFFDNANISMQDALNKIKVEGHKGPHPEEYHRIVYARLFDATKGIMPKSTEYKNAIENTLKELRTEIVTPNTKLNKLVTEGGK